MWGKINDLEINAPSSFTETNEVVGGYNITLMGNKRRFVKNVKKIWTFGYDIITNQNYADILYEFNRLSTSGLQTSQPYATFTVNDSRFSISGERVHMDVGDRNIIPATDLLSNFEITLTQL
jgi:hypothetical protein